MKEYKNSNLFHDGHGPGGGSGPGSHGPGYGGVIRLRRIYNF